MGTMKRLDGGKQRSISPLFFWVAMYNLVGHRNRTGPEEKDESGGRKPIMSGIRWKKIWKQVGKREND